MNLRLVYTLYSSHEEVKNIKIYTFICQSLNIENNGDLVNTARDVTITVAERTICTDT